MMKQMANSSNPVDRIYPISLFSIEAARAINLKNELTDSDLEVILTYLARDKSAILYDSQASQATSFYIRLLSNSNVIIGGQVQRAR